MSAGGIGFPVESRTCRRTFFPRLRVTSTRRSPLTGPISSIVEAKPESADDHVAVVPAFQLVAGHDRQPVGSHRRLMRGVLHAVELGFEVLDRRANFIASMNFESGLLRESRTQSKPAFCTSTRKVAWKAS